MATNDNTNYNPPEENEKTSSTSVLFKNTVNSVKDIFDTDLHRSLPILIVVGYVVIAFSGHLNSWINVFQYIVFVFFACLLSYIFYLIKSYPLFIIRKVRKFLNLLISFVKKNFIFEIFLIFICSLILIKLYFLISIFVYE